MFWNIILLIESCTNEKMGSPPRRTWSYTFPPLTQLVPGSWQEPFMPLSLRVKKLPGLHLYSHEFRRIWCDEKPCLYSSHFTHFLYDCTWEQSWQFSPLPGYHLASGEVPELTHMSPSSPCIKASYTNYLLFTTSLKFFLGRVHVLWFYF